MSVLHGMAAPICIHQLMMMMTMTSRKVMFARS